jgi:hypothetical protein
VRRHGVGWAILLVTACGGDAGDAADAGVISNVDAADVDCGCQRGAYVPVCGADGKTYDAACGTSCVPVNIACHGECPCSEAGGDAASTSPDASGPRSCQVNADCDTDQICFTGISRSCQGTTGSCVDRLASQCPQTVGAGCPCLDVSAGLCSGNSGGYCMGSDDPQGCWHCHLPL